MGNETSAFQNVTLGEEHRVDGKQGWSLHTATKKDGDTVSVFVYKKDKQFKQYVDNAVKHLKVLRHPSIVKFLWLRSTSDADLLITEHVRPLMAVIDTMTPGEICVGLYSMLEALSFLHEKGHSCHNNVCLSSIFVSDDGKWLIGAVEYICRFEEATNDYLQKCRSMRNQAAIPPEEKAGKVEANALYGEARDAYGFGVLAEQLLEYLVSEADTDVDEGSTKTFELRVQDECLNPQPSQRPHLSTLLNDRLFKTDFVEISNFLKQITLKTEEEKKEFFGGLAEKLHNVPVSVLASRLVRPLLARFVLLDPTADDSLMPHLLTPYSGANRPSYHPSSPCCPLLPVTLFRKHVLPELFKIFHVRDAHIRKVLLKYFPCYVEQFDEETLSETIMPQIVLGLRDADDELVAASLHSLGDLVTMIGADTVIGQGRTRVFASGKPKFANNGREPNKAERNGVLAERKSGRSKTPPASVSESPEKKKTLKEIAREAERQKRREEARQKAKDRQKKREEEKEKIKHIERPAPAMADTTSQPPPPLLEPDGESKTSTESHQSETLTQTDSEADNWEGWDEEENTENSIDSEIDREIEQELVTMGSPPAATNAKNTPISPKHFQNDAPKVQVDWSDAEKDKDKTVPSQKGRLKLTSAKTRTSPPPSSPLKSSSESSLKSPNRKHVQTPEAVKKVEPKLPAAKKVTKRTGNNQLGAEFDIKALDIKASAGISDEPDFFADMTPVITKSSGVLDIIQGGKEDKGKETTKGGSMLAYDVQDTEAAAADGWGDDFGDDWGNDD